ncbi:MAG TPA: efflux RND transporter periplasmic adaptor subunit [Aquabacterium sp.]|nr:efflux RND transporter periplasmic adaptor subunit [Aquabacterium sp.]
MTHKLAAIAIATLLTQGAWAEGSAAQPGAITVPTLTLAAAQSGAATQFDGVVEAVRQSTVAAQVPGNIIERLVKAGDAVKAGQVLMRIDSRDTQAALDMRQAEVSQAQAQLENARLQWERTQTLKAQGFVSAAALDSAQAQLKTAQAAVAAAQAGRNQAALAKGYTNVVAPFDGLVLSTMAEVGDLAGPGRPVLTLYSPQAMRAVVQVPASQSDALKAAKQVAVETAQGWVAPTKITPLPGTDPVSQTVEWRLDLPKEVKGLLPGQTIKVRWNGVDTASTAMTAQPLTVPSSAVLRRGELSAVYVVRDGRFVLQSVRTGPASGSAPVTVWSGIKAGDRIAADAVRAGLAGATPQAK